VLSTFFEVDVAPLIYLLREGEGREEDIGRKQRGESREEKGVSERGSRQWRGEREREGVT
jgi:hypothetical protein